MAKTGSKPGVCGTCTIQLVRIAYRRAPWFRLVREPIKAGMLFMGRLYRVDPKDYNVPTASCAGCLRFTKTGLLQKSGLARWLNARINPVFDRVLEGSLVTKEELAEAKQYARSACPRS